MILTLPFWEGTGVGMAYANISTYQPATMPAASMHSTSSIRSSSAPIYTTSSATVHCIGSGGGAGGGITSGASHRGTYVPVHATTVGVKSVQLPALSISRQNYASLDEPVMDYTIPRPRRVEEDDHETDPYDGEVVPIGNTPWMIILLMGVGYIAYVAYKRRKASK